MRIVHVCLSNNVFNKDFAYQDNILPKYHRLLGNEVSIIAPIYSDFDKKNGNVICVKPGCETINYGIMLYRLEPVFRPSIDMHIHWFKKFDSTVESLNPDFIFVHSIASINYRFFAKYKKKHPEVKIVFDNHADWNNSCRTFLSRIYFRFVVRRFIVSKIKDLSDHFYGVVPARCDFLHQMCGISKEKIFLLPMGADDEEMHINHKLEFRKEIRERFGISDNDFLIVTGGKIDRIKNIHVLTEAVSKSQFKNIKILVFGSIHENLKETFEQLWSNRIHYAGWQPSNEVYHYFYAADIVMFPGLHSVLWEQAVASKVPCAFSRIKGFEHVDIGGNCVFMDGKDVDYYQNLIEEIYQNKDKYEQMKKAASSDASQQFLYSKIAQKVLDDISVTN